MTYTLHYTSQDVAEDSTTLSTWSVYREEYPTRDAEEPIDGSQALVSSWPNEDEADAEANRLQALANADYSTKTERVAYTYGQDHWFGTVQRRFTADDNGTDREFAVVRFGPFEDPGPESFHRTADLDHLTYNASLEVDYDGGMDSPEDAALALIEWVARAGPGDVYYVHATGDDGYTYTVGVTWTGTRWTAALEGANKPSTPGTRAKNTGGR